MISARSIDSRKDYLPVSNDESGFKLRQRILAKARGSFLWVSLVLQELGQVYSEEAAEEVLDEVPTDMNAFYARILEGITKNPRAQVLARSILMWTLLSWRPLKLDELKCAIKLDTDQTVHNLESSMVAICGQLVCLSPKEESEVIHQTVKVYLLKQTGFPSLAVDKPRCHTRI